MISRKVILFDVNETLLDIAALEPWFERAFGDPKVCTEWFALMIHSALVCTAAGSYAEFGTIGAAALEQVARRHGVTLAAGQEQQLFNGMQQLPPHPEVDQALGQLRAAGLRLAALTNSTMHVVQTQLAYAGLTDYFEAILSADVTHRLKPAPQPYRLAADVFGVGVQQLCLVAAHGWDIAGAQLAGCAGAFVARPGKALDPMASPPAIMGDDLSQVAARILASNEPATRTG